MNATLCTISALLGLWSVLVIPAAAQLVSARQNSQVEPGAWATERVELVDGRAYQGLIESEEEAWITFVEIRRPRTRPMHLVVRPIQRNSIAEIARLDPDRRAALRRRVAVFIHRAQIEAGKMEAVRLQKTDEEGTCHYRYRGKWFLLEATTDEATTRRLIVRLEQRFTAYRQVLPPRLEPERPLRLAVFGSLEEYDTYLASRGLGVGNRAVFLPQENLVAAGSELARYTAEMAALEARHDKLREELGRLKKQLPERLERLSGQLRRQGRTRPQIRNLLAREKRTVQGQIDQKLGELAACDRENNRALDQVAGQMLRRLYHEAFHAYLENYVYPHQSHQVPHWLAEGLAMLFEGRQLESGSLRLDTPNRTALEQLQADLKSGRPLSLTQLLTADAGDFLVPAGALSGPSNRHYAHAWGLVYYLTFEKQLLTTPALDAYVAPAAQTMPPIPRFENLVGTPAPTFEKTWQDHMLRVR